MTHDSDSLEESTDRNEIRRILRGGGPRQRTALIWLTGLLLLQTGILLWVYWPRADAASEPVPILGDMSVDQVAGFSITDEAGEQIQLAKNEDKWWVLLSPGGRKS